MEHFEAHILLPEKLGETFQDRGTPPWTDKKVFGADFQRGLCIPRFADLGMWVWKTPDRRWRETKAALNVCPTYVFGCFCPWRCTVVQLGNSAPISQITVCGALQIVQLHKEGFWAGCRFFYNKYSILELYRTNTGGTLPHGNRL